jgi:hypothetical protein
MKFWMVNAVALLFIAVIFWTNNQIIPDWLKTWGWVIAALLSFYIGLVELAIDRIIK